MNLKVNLTKAMLLLIPLAVGWGIITLFDLSQREVLPLYPINGSGSSVQSSSSAIPKFTVTVINKPQYLPRAENIDVFQLLKTRGALKKFALSGSVFDGSIRIVVSTRDPQSIIHDSFLGVGLIVVNPIDGNNLLRGNFLESEWIGDGRKQLSPSRSPGLLLPGQRRVYEYNLNHILVSQDADPTTKSFPSGQKEFKMLDALRQNQRKPLLFGIYTTQLDFGVIESVEIIYSGSGSITVQE